MMAIIYYTVTQIMLSVVNSYNKSNNTLRKLKLEQLRSQLTEQDYQRVTTESSDDF
jgi:hypothetical protein